MMIIRLISAADMEVMILACCWMKRSPPPYIIETSDIL